MARIIAPTTAAASASWCGVIRTVRLSIQLVAPQTPDILRSLFIRSFVIEEATSAKSNQIQVLPMKGTDQRHTDNLAIPPAV
jgi:hypothetical protein